MFNLGYKEIVLNELDGVVIDAERFMIPGYANLLASGTTSFKMENGRPAVAQGMIFTVPGDGGNTTAGTALGAIGDVYNVVISLDEYTNRNRSDFARDFIVDGEKIVFQSTPMKAATNDAAAEAIIEGFNLWVSKFTNAATVMEISAGTAANRFLVQMTKEGITLLLKRIDPVVIQLANPMDNKKIALNTAGNPSVFSRGRGQGRLIEESRRMATWENIRVYGENIGGNSLGIDVHGFYTQYFITCVDDSNPSGWEDHEYVKHGYVQASMKSKPRNYVIYINEKLFADMNTAPLDLNAFIAAVTSVVVSGVTAGTAISVDSAAPGTTGQVDSVVTYSSGAGTGLMTYASSNPGMASVDASGVVTAVAAGSVIITATSTEDGSFSGDTVVTVA